MSAKKRKKRKPGSARLKRCKGSKRRKNTEAENLYEPNEYVSWVDEHNDYVEGCVLQDSVTCMSVMTHSHCVVTLDARARLRAKYSDWRERLDVGDIVEYLTLNKDWIFCKVRGFQWPPEIGESPIAVIEPVFVGRCISVPIKSLKLRKIPRLPPEIAMLQQSGFAFYEGNTAPANWPPYTATGCSSFYWLEDSPVAEDYNAFDGTSLFKLRAHPVVPPNVCLVRDSHGVLFYMLKTELGQRCANSKLHVPQEVCLGTLNLSFGQSKQSGEESETWNGVDLAQKHLNMGHCVSSAVCASKAIREITWQDDCTKRLADALLSTLCTDIESRRACHPVTRLVWQHNYTDLTRYGSKSDLLSLSDSLNELDLHDTDENITFRNHICIWQMYPQLWLQARRFIIDSETYSPLRVNIDKISNEVMTFTVSAMISGENPFAHKNADKHNFADMTTIMSAFTPGMWPPPPESKDSSEFLKAGWHYDSMNAFGKARTSIATADEMLRREASAHARTLHSSVTHKAVCQPTRSDSQVVAWNVLEGPVATEPSSNTMWSSVSGGVLVEANSFAKMESMAHFLRNERNSASNLSSTLIVTKPTLLHEWYEVLETMGVPCFMYHGSKRHDGHQLNTAVDRGHTIITTAYSMCNARDRWRLFSINAWESPYRVVLDNLMGEKILPSGVVSTITSTHTQHVWILEKELNGTVVGTAVALLKIRPFYKRARWDRDFCTELEQRQYTRTLLSTTGLFTELHRPKLKPLWDMRYDLIRNLCVCNSHLNVNFANCVSHSSLRSAHDPSLQRVFDMFKAKHFPKWGIDVLLCAEPTVARFGKLTESLVKMMYGILPRLSMFTKRLASGEYTTDESVFERRMNQRKEGAQIKKAKAHVKKLLAKECIQETCPICMEGICLNTTESVLGQCVFDISKCAAVGTCGHIVCGACADELQRVAMENCASNANDYGMGDNTVNRPRCPLCRDPWDTGAPPLLLTNSKSHVLQSDGKGIYSCHRGIAGKRHNRKATALLDLQNLLQSLENEKKIVIVCQSANLAEWLAEVANEQGRTKAVVVGCKKSVVSRRNALRDFRCDAEISQLYISAKLCAGLALCASTFVIADRIHSDYTKDVLYMLYSSWNNQASPVVVHSMQGLCNASPPESWNGELLGTARVPHMIYLQDVASLLEYDDLENMNSEHSFLPQLPKTRQGYKGLLHNAYGMPSPPVKAERASTIVPISLESVHSSNSQLQTSFVHRIFEELLDEGVDGSDEFFLEGTVVARTASAPAALQQSEDSSVDSGNSPAVGLYSASGAATV